MARFLSHFYGLWHSRLRRYHALVPRANRYILPGFIYHLTHRCHDRKFLLKFAKDRDAYRKRLRQAVIKHGLSLLSYNITSNHVHLLTFSDYVEQVAAFMQSSAGEFAREYNRRKNRGGAFWEGRYHATLVDSGSYLWQCLQYVELNMVRCGAVKHPRDWEWSGFEELMGLRRRNRLLDVNKLRQLLGNPTLEEFREHLEFALSEAVARDQAKRESRWTESLAVGSQEFVQAIEPCIRNRRQTRNVQEGNVWILREDYCSFSRLEKRPIHWFWSPGFESTNSYCATCFGPTKSAGRFTPQNKLIAPQGSA